MQKNANLVDSPAITVVVPVYNVEDSLEKCVQSIRQQTFSNIEILLVDDGSTDNSGRLCETLAEADKRIRVIHQENGGLSSARNTGIRNAAGEYIGLVDSDDYIAEDMYEVLYNNLIKEDAEVSACNHALCFDGRIENHSKSGYEVMSGLDFMVLSLKGEEMTISACIKLYKKELLLNTPFTPGRLYEDALLLGQLYPKVKKVVVDYAPKYYYVRHTGTITTKTYSSRKLDNIRAFEENLNVIRQYCPEHEDVAWYRVFRANFEVMDSILQADNDDARRDKITVKSFIRSHIFKILGNRFIVPTRKLAVLALAVSESLYKQMLKRKNNNQLI